jgi:FtsZ-interacting cell division protein ZipA
MSNNPYEKNAKHYLIITLIIIAIAIIASLFSSCSTVHKHKTIEQSKVDSSTIKANDIATAKNVDSATSKQTVVTDETTVNVEFEGDTSKETKPVEITVNKGKIEVNAGNRKIKSIAATAKNNVDSNSKTSVATTETLVDKTTTATQLHKENEAVEIDKKTSRSKIIFSIAALGALFGIFLFIKRKKKEIEQL